MGDFENARIVCAALKYADKLVIGPRHFDHVMQSKMDMTRMEMEEGKPERPEQGFIDQHGVFYRRRAAWAIAELHGQIIRRVGGDGPNGHGLFSENLY